MPQKCIPVERCVKMLMSDIHKIEKSTFQCTYINSVGMVTVDLKFKIGELLNDISCLLSCQGSSATMLSFSLLLLMCLVIMQMMLTHLLALRKIISGNLGNILKG